MTSESSAQYVPLKDFENRFEILNQFPFTIRRKRDGFEISEYIDKGYPRVCINGKHLMKHRLIAIQFIPNPDNLPEVDHISRIKTDYHLDNLRWVSKSSNCRNRVSNNGIKFEYVDSVPDDAIVVNDYGNHTFEDYYFHNNVFYFFNGIQYRKLHINEMKNNALCVNMIDIEGKRVKVFYSKFKKLYDLI